MTMFGLIVLIFTTICGVAWASEHMTDAMLPKWVLRLCWMDSDKEADDDEA